MKKTVIQLLSSISDGGAETLVKDYALLMDAPEVEVKIVTVNPPSTESANYRQLLEGNKEVYSIYEKYPISGNWILQKVWNKCFYKRYVCRKLAEILGKEDVVCIHVHNSLLQYLKPISKKLLSKKILYTCHSLPGRYFNDTDKRKEKQAAEYLFKHNDFRIIALHEEMREVINRMFSVDNTLIVRNGVDFERFRNVAESAAEIRAGLNIPENAFVVGHVGRFSYMKNHSFLVDIFAEIAGRRDDAFLLLVGDGPEKADAINKLEDLGLLTRTVILSGRSDIPRLLKAMDIFIFPSKFEGLPVSIVESQVAGLRTIASDVITKECFFSGDIVPVSISEPAARWAEIALDNSVKGPYRNDINEFDMEHVLSQLKSIYLNENCTVHK